VSTNPAIDQYAAAIRQRLGAATPAMRKQAKQIAGDFHRDLDGIPDEQIGAVLLRAAAFATNLVTANPGASARDLANMLGAAGERLYHHPAEAELDCESR
jgi:hypothetical protein